MACAGWWALLLVAACLPLAQPIPVGEKHVPFAHMVKHGLLSSDTYDLEAASILHDADSSTHGFVAMLEEAADDDVNMMNLYSAFLELPPALEREGDYDDGGPEAIRSMASPSAADEPQQQVLGHTAPVPAALDIPATQKDELDTSLVQQNDASVLGDPNPPGSQYNSDIPNSFSDTTTNLATLTQTVEDTKYRIDQLTRFIKRRLKCRVDPESCAETKPEREIKPKEECKHRYKYLCRTTYELTPGASSAATGGPAPESLLMQTGAITTKAPAPIAKLADEKAGTHVPLEKLVEKQRHQIEEQSRLLRKVTAQLQQLQTKEHGSDHSPLKAGSAEDTGATPTKVVGTLPAAADVVADQSTTAETATPAATAADEAAPTAVDEHVEEHAPAAVDDTNTPAPAVEAPPAETAAVVEDTPAAAEPTAADTPSAPVMNEKLGETANIQQSATTTATATATTGTAIRSPQGPAERAAAMASAKTRAFQKQHKLNMRDGTHERAAQWASKVLAVQQKSKAARRSSSVYVPDHLRGINVLAELDEGLTVPPVAVPSSDVVHALAAASFEEMKQQQRDAELGLTSLAQLDAGVGLAGMPSDDVILKLAEQAVEKNHSSKADLTTSLLAVPRKCVEKDTQNMCQEFDDGTRCVRTDNAHALCGFATSATGLDATQPRQFAAVDISSITA